MQYTIVKLITWCQGGSMASWDPPLDPPLKELFNLPSLALKARHLGGSAFCNFYRLGVPEQALCAIPLVFEIVVEDKAFMLILL